MNNYEQASYYAVIPANVRYDKNLRANEKLLYGEISALTNKTGKCWASNKYFADIYGVTTQAVSKWVLNLKKGGYISIDYTYKAGSKEIENRIIKMVSTNVDEVSTNDLEVSTNVDRGINNGLQGYQQKFKENNTSNNNTSINNTNNIKPSQIEKEFENEFETLWELYPRKVSKKEALKCYIRARKNGVDYDIVKRGIENYNQFIRQNGVKKEYIKHGSTWFNQECWNDEYTTNKELKTSYSIDDIKKKMNNFD